MVNESPPLPELPILVIARTDDDVGISVPIEIPCGGHRAAEESVRKVALGNPIQARKTSRGTVIDERGPLLVLAIAVVFGAENDIREPIPVHVSRSRH